MKNYRKEFIFWILILLPYVYLAFVWDRLPQTIGIHFDINGEADSWDNKVFLLYMPQLLMIGIYLLFLYMPKLVPTKKIEQMGNKYFHVRFIISLLLFMICMYQIYVAQSQSLPGLNGAMIILGVFIAILGNYLPALRQNYFIGIRTPWTLESESVWKSTHRACGPIWLVCGILLALLGLLVSDKTLFVICVVSILTVIILFALIYSYLQYKKEKQLN